MVDQRKEPTLSSVLEPESVPANNPSSAARRQQPQKPTHKPQVIVRKESSGLLWFTFFLVLILIAAAAYGGWQFISAQQLIQSQQLRIDELESKLTLSGDESAQSLTSLSANLRTMSNDVKLALTEIDKLWNTRNVNRKSIEENKQAAKDTSESLKKTMAPLQKDLKALAASIKKQQKSLAAIESKTEGQLGEFDKLKKDISGQEILVQSLKERVASQASKLKALQASAGDNTAVTQKINSVAAKVKTNDEAIQAIDAFRRTVSRDILLLKERTGGAQ